MPRPRSALLGLAAALALAGCSPDAPGPLLPGTEPTPAASTAPTAVATTTLSGSKRIGGQTLPTTLGGWRVTSRQNAGAGATSSFYTSADAPKVTLVATLTPVPLTPAALAAALPDAHAIGSATCGSLAGGPRTACYVPLQGGNLRLVATLDPDQLGPIAEQFYAALNPS